jgi:putative transcriptional regulator
MNKHGANVQTDSLDHLCAYFGCDIGDLVEYFPDAPSQESRPDAD